MPKPLVALDGPARAMLFGALARNVGLLPHEASGGLLDIQNALASVAMPMLLFGADLREVSRRTGSRRRSSAVTEKAGRGREGKERERNILRDQKIFCVLWIVLRVCM